MVSELETVRFTETALGVADAGVRTAVEALFAPFMTPNELDLDPRATVPRVGGAAIAGFSVPETLAPQPIPDAHLSQAAGHAILAREFAPVYN